MFHLIRFVLAGLFVLIAQHAWTQNREEKKEAIKAMAFVYNDSIALRWAPTTPVAWQLTNKYGYYIERVTVTRNNRIIQPEKVTFFKEPLKPWPEERWAALMDNDDMLAIAAQAIYGSSFETTSDYSSDVMQVINMSKELEQRYSFALLAADLSRTAATASAISFVDKDIKRNERYLYKVYTAIPANTMKVDTGFVYIGYEDKRELPKPQKVSGLPGDKTVMLSWAKNYYDDLYIAYRVEKSEDGKTFKSITSLPIINTEPAEGIPADRFYKLDSLEENNKTFYYRVCGLTPFGDTGPPSEAVSMKGAKPFKATAAITKTEVSKSNTVILHWVFPEEEMQEVRGFNVLRSTNPSNQFELVNTQLLGAGLRTYTDVSPRSTNYYKIQAISKSDQSSVSYANLIQLADSIPPAMPLNLQAKVVGTEGLVTLSWQANKEDDLLGYRIFRSNFKGEEYAQITVSPMKEVTYTDTIATKTLTEKVYYKIVAVDTRHNTSDFSSVVEVARPDVLPPAPPSFQGYKVTAVGAELRWAPSPSTDVVRHELWRTNLGDKMSIFLKEFISTDSTKTFLDVTIRNGELYEYKIVAFDDAGFKTQNAQVLKVKIPLTNRIPGPLTVSGNANRVEKLIELRWQEQPEGVKQVNIYRAKGTEALALYKTLPFSNGFNDAQVEMNTTYRYRIQALSKEGVSGKMSDEVVVAY